MLADDSSASETRKRKLNCYVNYVPEGTPETFCMHTNTNNGVYTTSPLTLNPSSLRCPLLENLHESVRTWTADEIQKLLVDIWQDSLP